MDEPKEKERGDGDGRARAPPTAPKGWKTCSLVNFGSTGDRPGDDSTASSDARPRRLASPGDR